MKASRRVNRRSFLGRVAGGLVFAGASRAASAQGNNQVTGITDRDPTDAVGNGRGNTMRSGTLPSPERPPQSPFRDNQENNRHAQSGVTDSDPTDPVGDGRGVRPQGAPASPYRDNQQNNRHAQSGITDSDPTDPVGDGRGANAARARLCSDADAGPSADPARRGRHC